MAKIKNKHIPVIEALAQKAMGLERDTLLKTAKLPNLQQKIGIFRDTTKTSKALWLTFITTKGLSQNTYPQSLTMDALFDK